MGFFSKADPIQALKNELEKKPKDHKKLLDLAGLLKAKGSLGEAAEYFQRAADELNALGFATKAVAILRQVIQLQPRSIAAHESLATLLEQSKMKEDQRTVLKALVSLYRAAGQNTEATAAQAKIDALGPGR